MSQYDALLVLEDALSSAKTTTGQSTGIAVKLGKSLVSVCKIVVSDLDTADADEVYTLALEVSDTLGSGYVEVGRVVVSETGIHEIAIAGSLAEKLKAGSVYARLNWTLAGTTPSINFVGYLSKT